MRAFSGEAHTKRRSSTLESLSRQFKRNPESKVAAVLGALESLGLVEVSDGTYQLRDT